MISNTALAKLEAHLISSSEKAKEEQWNIGFGKWNYDKQCCPMYAAFVLSGNKEPPNSHDLIDYSNHISLFLEETFTERDLQAFLAGYDRPLLPLIPRHDERIFELGKKIREMFSPCDEKPGDKYLLDAQNIVCPSIDEMKEYIAKNEMPSSLSSHYVSCSTCRDNVSKISNIKLDESVSDQLLSYEKNWMTKLKEKAVQLWNKISSIR